jgi:hypothetical protein
MILRWDMPARFLRAMRRAFNAWIWNDPLFAKPETIRKRTAQCLQCEFRDGQQCRLCGCFIYAKATLQSERCPAPTPRWIDVAE